LESLLFSPRGVTYLVDTNILIDHLRGDARATEFLLDIETGRTKGCVSVLTEYELLSVSDLKANEKREIERLLLVLPRLAITSRVARLAAEFRSRYHTDIADALIAATARARSATLVTRNLKDFQRIKGLRLQGL
jgi:predicted nucleic acid-binding protein